MKMDIKHKYNVRVKYMFVRMLIKWGLRLKANSFCRSHWFARHCVRLLG